jgi:hypothetical protein
MKDVMLQIVKQGRRYKAEIQDAFGVTGLFVAVFLGGWFMVKLAVLLNNLGIHP